MISHLLFLIGAFLALFSFANAQASETCPSEMKTHQDVIVCAESRSPEVQSALLEIDRSKASIEAAGQWQNPQLSAETFQGKTGGQNQSETDISLGVPIELGGKISARKGVAKGGLGLAEAKLYEARAKVRSQVLLKLHRLRQVIHEQEIADEAIRTFTKLIGQYNKRPSLSPEQQISFSVYQLSKSEYELKRSSTVEEILGLDAFFKFNLGLSVEKIRSVLPSSPKTWPKVGVSENMRASPKQQILQAELDTAKAELSLAQSEAWPTLTVGPSLKMQTESGQSNNLMGLNVSLPLPLFNVNGGGRAAAAAGVKLNETRRDLGLREQVVRREELQKVYEQSIKAMTESLSHENIEQRHRDAERLFTKGVVPSSLVIEAHRTSFELEKTRHEREIRALEALLDLYAIDGNILEVNL